eukprot:GHVO01045525.1.p1 GENE.GHVO01045525.1~~GHVO01045525.1.p1  ORF type:complete len:160 (-),score=15.05 GHVO01045525.1:10-489(-)
MLDLGVIRPSCSPYASPVILITKKDGSVKMAVDFRALNKVTKKDQYSIPRIESLRENIGYCKFFVALDLHSGYWQIPLRPEDCEKTAFVTHYGLYEFVTQPYGLCNAPATFQRLMDRLFGDLRWKQVLVYIDDIIIGGQTYDEVLEKLEIVLTRLRRQE